MSYVAGIGPNTSVWPPGAAPLPPQTRSARGRPQRRLQRDEAHQPVTVKALALSLPDETWQTITWREGSADWLVSRFARRRVRPAHRDTLLSEPRAEEWLLIEWPQDETEPTKYWLSTLPEDTPIEVLVDTAKLRWRIERDYEELKSELGLAHFEGRGWRGFHHHATLCIAAYGFLIRERAAFPPSGPRRREGPVLPRRPRPRSAPDPTRAPRRELDRHPAKATDRRPRPVARPMPVLPIVHAETTALSALMTQ